MSQARSPKPNPLATTQRPGFEASGAPLRVVDLFCGCGGITLGAAQAALVGGRRLDIRLAVDTDSDATAVYERNFPRSRRVATDSVESMFSSEWGAALTSTEAHLKGGIGRVDLLAGGPPCQGHSSLNNHTRGDDPKNGLYLFMARAARVLRPRAVLIENVPSVAGTLHDGALVVEVAQARLEECGYNVFGGVVAIAPLGVAQSRKRHILLAVGKAHSASEIFASVVEPEGSLVTVRDAIGDLVEASDSAFDAAPRASNANRKRMEFLIRHDLHDLPNEERPPCQQDAHSYKSMYGRMHWDAPAQTVTSGFGSIGQGRYMHPGLARALTPHEAARLQGFPDYFSFADVERRTSLATIIGNAVPPHLTKAIVIRLMAEGVV